MLTRSWQNVQDIACELAGRTRDKFPISEQAMLISYADQELKTMWNAAAWPELCDNLQSYTPTNTNGVLTIPINEAAVGQIGDVLWAGTQDPRNTTGPRACQMRTSIGNDVIYILEPIFTGVVWLDWQLPPIDLLGNYLNPGTLPNVGFNQSVVTFPTLLIPARFFQPLAYKIAGKLIAIENPPLSAYYSKEADSVLDWQGGQPEMKPPRWREAILRRR